MAKMCTGIWNSNHNIFFDQSLSINNLKKNLSQIKYSLNIKRFLTQRLHRDAEQPMFFSRYSWEVENLL